MKAKIYSILTVAAFLVVGLTMASFTSNADNNTTIEITNDGDCDKCKDAKCDGKCDAKAEHKCTDECKKDGKCSHADADHKCTEECKKDGKCSHKAEVKSETPKKKCGEKKSCGSKKGCGKH